MTIRVTMRSWILKGPSVLSTYIGERGNIWNVCPWRDELATGKLIIFFLASPSASLHHLGGLWHPIPAPPLLTFLLEFCPQFLLVQ